MPQEKLYCFECGKELTVPQFRYDDEDERMLPVCDEHSAGSFVHTGE